jgi:hypothetical protein
MEPKKEGNWPYKFWDLFEPDPELELPAPMPLEDADQVEIKSLHNIHYQTLYTRTGKFI